MELHYIHGHDCIHNLISSVHLDDIDAQYLRLMNDSVTVCWAVHPFNSAETLEVDYAKVCNDFGYQLERVVHPWNSLSVSELYQVLLAFNWSTHNSDPLNAAALLDPKYIYWEWYTRLFHSLIDSDTYFNNILGR